jgi:Protein of unknown function (DUF4230)
MQSKSTLALLLFGLIIGIILTKLYYTRQTERVVESSVLLEQIKTVTKVITVEGHFSELMTQNSYQGNFGFLWDKKAIVQVRAKVSAGYDLNRMQLVIDESTHTLRMKNLPKAEILSIDQQLSYYDINEGLFESFTAQDYTQIQADARRKIEEAAQRSNLLQSAENQGNTLVKSIVQMAEQAGYKVETDFKL